MITRLVQDYGLWLLFIVVALESAGVPLPGETALVAAGVLAAKGSLPIAGVIAVAALAAIIGDNVGYLIGRQGGRRLLDRWGPVRRFSQRALPPTERFFARHGPKTVFLARFITGLRVTAAWMAGIGHMKWWTFFRWNAAGGIVWAVAVGLVAFYFGRSVANAISKYGLIGALAVIGLGIVLLIGFHIWKKRRWEAEEEGA